MATTMGWGILKWPQVGDFEVDIRDIFSRNKFPSVLGSETFINRVKEKFFHKKRHDEIPESRRLAPEAEKIKKAICNAYGIEESSLLSSRRGVLNEPRNGKGDVLK